MRNRAKCRLCEQIIESFHRHDFVSCKCGEISIDGGNDYFRCFAIDWQNFIRVDEMGNEIPIQVKEKKDDSSQTNNNSTSDSDICNTSNANSSNSIDAAVDIGLDVGQYQGEPIPRMSKEELVEMLDTMIKNVEALPQQAMLLPINHYDYCSLMILLSQIFRSS